MIAQKGGWFGVSYVTVGEPVMAEAASAKSSSRSSRSPSKGLGRSLRVGDVKVWTVSALEAKTRPQCLSTIPLAEAMMALSFGLSVSAPILPQARSASTVV